MFRLLLALMATVFFTVAYVHHDQREMILWGVFTVIDWTWLMLGSDQ